MMTSKNISSHEMTRARSINEIQDEVVDEFADLDDWMDKYQMLIDLGNDLEALDEKYKNEQNLIDGCQSRVWLQCDYRDGALWFTADSDALIVKGIIALLLRVDVYKRQATIFTLALSSKPVIVMALV